MWSPSITWLNNKRTKYADKNRVLEINGTQSLPKTWKHHIAIYPPKLDAKLRYPKE